MPSHYSILRYVPDPVADESINVGVAAFSGNAVEVRLSEDLSRARVLAGREPIRLKEVLSDIAAQQHAEILSESIIRRYAESWQNQLQWTPPRPSTKSVSELIEEIASLYLRSGVQQATKARRPGKRRAVRLAIDSLTMQMTARYSEPRTRARKMIKTDYSTNGRLEEHDLDIAVVNGALKAGAFAVSFSVASRSILKRDLDATAFAVEDLKRASRDLPLSVLGYTEAGNPRDVKRAGGLFKSLGVEFVPETKIPSWSKQIVNGLPAHLFS